MLLTRFRSPRRLRHQSTVCAGIIWCVFQLPWLKVEAAEGDRHIRPEDKALEDYKRRVEVQDLATKRLINDLKKRLDRIDPPVSANEEETKN